MLPLSHGGNLNRKNTIIEIKSNLVTIAFYLNFFFKYNNTVEKKVKHLINSKNLLSIS